MTTTAPKFIHTPESLAALEASIKIWEGRLVSFREMGACPLCTYSHARKAAAGKVSTCYGCPIYVSTGEPQCHATPYYAAKCAARREDIDYFIIHAEEMLDLLRGLLPDDRGGVITVTPTTDQSAELWTKTYDKWLSRCSFLARFAEKGHSTSARTVRCG